MAELPSAAWLAEITRFEPPKQIAPPPDWDEAVQVLARHGLAPIASYNLTFKMPLTDAPQEVKDILHGFMQGTANDNVFKFVTLKGMVGDLAGVQMIVVGGGSLTETLYPHIAFRPVPDIELLVRPADLPQVIEAMKEERFFEVELDEPDPEAPAAVLYNDRFFCRLYTSILPNEQELPGLFERALPARALGPSISRLAAEDALVVHALSLARRGFVVPLIQLVDLREMVLGNSPLAFRGGPGAPIDPAVVKERARAFGAERALWAAMELLVHYHPSVEAQARAVQPEIGFAARTLLRTAVVEPAFDFTRERQLKAVGKLQQLLFG